ncbi:hypothetical protein ACWA7J_15195 [Leptothrix sp. BB-4]
MPYALVWSVVLILLALWSLTAWVLHAASVWAVTHAGGLGDVATGIGAVRPPEWLALWVPAELLDLLPAMLADLGPFVQSLLEAAPALSGGLTVLAWAIWAIGGLMLIGAGVAGHLGLLAWRRRTTQPAMAPRRVAIVD